MFLSKTTTRLLVPGLQAIASRGCVAAAANQSNFKQLQAAKLSTSSHCYAGHGNMDPRLYVVGPYPRTKGEREFAARKYNLIPEDYEPFEEGEAMGDYPTVPLYDCRNDDLYEDYDDFSARHIYGLPLARDSDLYEPTKAAVNRGADTPLWFQGLVFFSLVATPILISFAINYFDIHINHAYKSEKEYGFKKLNQVHFDFPETSSHETGHGGGHHHQ